MFSILRQPQSEIVSQDQRFAMFVKSLRELRERFSEKIAHFDSPYQNFEKYAFLMFVREHVESLDKASQVIFYHTMTNVDIEATKVITSLSQEKIEQSLIFMHKSALNTLESYDIQGVEDDFWHVKAFIDDLVYSFDKSDTEIVKIYKEDVAVVKILRRLAKPVLNSNR